MNRFDPNKNELDQALWGLRKHFYPVVLFSFFLNILQLTPTIYMLQLYDRVLSSRDEATLLALTVMVLFLYLISGSLEWVRSHLMVRFGLRVDEALRDRIFEATLRAAVRGQPSATPLTDLGNLRQFLAGPALIAFFDLPWTVIFLAVLFLLHPLLGAISLLGGAFLIAMTYLTEKLTQKPLSEANAAMIRSSQVASSSLRNAEVIAAMGMGKGVQAKWMEEYRRVLGLQAVASDRAGTIGSTTRFTRIALQSGILGAGAYLAISGNVSGGVMFAGSVLMGRMLSPIETGIANWKGFVGARDAYFRLASLLTAFPQRRETMDLPAPKGEISVEGLVVAAPGSNVPILKGVTFKTAPGEAVAVIGPSASGKSTLARALVGVWQAASGKVRLDGSDIYEWDKAKLGPHVGYLPQDIELFNGTIAENIARFSTPDSEMVIAAAKLAGLHEAFLRFPQGYDTVIGDSPASLSAGQRQRIGLARALYGAPALIVLDEPNSNLDDAGDAALLAAILDLKSRGKTIFVITHRVNVVSAVDRILMLKDGTLGMYGPREAVLAMLKGGPAPGGPGAPPRPSKSAPEHK
ncbi:MAG: type I secretion system permease/ATPase [Proteobacteria bacterium]|nr:type I secretion system permease/ATPase [Pseudomonadota bacterium]